MVLSPLALSYGERAIRSLLAHSFDAIHLTLLTDSAEDKQFLTRVTDTWSHPRHTVSVFSHADLEPAAKEKFARLPQLHGLRRGHPCWRKITDPLLLTEPDEEIIVLDPDVYFPAYFRFEPTPPTGVLLMWQEPNCLFPYQAVERAFAAGIPLARQVDIGVAQWRGGDLAWLDATSGTIMAERNLASMHIEAVLWSAIAMHKGGYHLDPSVWVCWRNTMLKRAALTILTPDQLLRLEPLRTATCFHAGGSAKHWLARAGWLLEREPPDAAEVAAAPATRNPYRLPFRALAETAYRRQRRLKRLLTRATERRLTGH